ncbi:MAG: hypothetical protein ACHQZS_06705 [Candidatus Binatales bacterium]
MPEQNADWTGKWVAQRLEGQPEVQEVELLAPQVLRIIRKEHQPFLAGTIASPRVEPSTFEQLLNSSFRIEFVANVPKESMWSGEAIKVASRHSVAFGGMGDLLSAISLPDVNLYVRKEFAFVERGLCQHMKVSGIERVHDRKYVVKRRNLSDVSVVLLNEYELTADHVRTARNNYGAFAAILVTNPNGGMTSSAKQAAESMGAQIYKWGEFLGRLNKR